MYLFKELNPVFKTVVLICLFSSYNLKALAQSNRELEPIKRHYKTQAALSSAVNPSRSFMDTIKYPWSEYSQNALTNMFVRTVYLSKVDEAKLPGLIKPPANSSDKTRAELDYLLSLQNNRTKDQIDRAQYIANIGSWFNILNPDDPDYNENRKQLFYIAEELGDWYNYQNFPATTKLLLNCIQDIRVTEFRLKFHFKRARPYHLEPQLHPLARINSPSFASGHSLWSFTEAYIFSEIIPEKREMFLAKAEEVRWSRELMGIHYPSDNEASRVIGWYLVKFWYNNPQFVADMQKAKIEWLNKKGKF
ncbi:MAG: phosphatase PAP2 family protein [Bacteroidota bacterium]